MEIRRVILSLSAIALIAPAIARADDAVPCPYSEAQEVGSRWGDRDDDDDRWNRDRDHDGDRDERWEHHRRGRWELQTRNQWIEGRYDQVWVPEQCQKVFRPGHPRGPRARRAVVCRPGHYESRWIPGRYEQVQQWVWVPWR